jgi:hypothetical protein
MVTAVAPASSVPETATEAIADADLGAVETLLQGLARAIHQFHTYPPASPRCVDAIEESHRALKHIPVDVLACVVRPRELLVSGIAIGRDTPIEQELARRLYESRAQTISISRSATPRDLARFCTELAARRRRDNAPLNERLRKHGVDAIEVSAAYQPVLLDVGASAQACAAVEVDRSRQDAQPAGMRVTHLYPPDKGWVRLDPALPLNQVTLTGLARLVEDPASLAAMLGRLASEADAPASTADALEQRCEDIARLYAALDPAVARTRLARLASAVLALDSNRRRRLLSHKLLPGLVDGRPEGDVLRDFPDVDLADALALLLDVETAAPELLTSALDRLHLPPDRQQAVAPLLEDRIRARHAGSAGWREDAALRERTQQLIQIVNGNASFHDFAAYDLCTDAATEAFIAGANEAIRATNLPDAELACVAHLLSWATDAETADGLLRHAIRLLGQLEQTQSLHELASRLELLGVTATALHDSRPDVSTSIGKAIEAFYTPARFERLVAMYDGAGEQRALAHRIVSAAGAALATPVVNNLQERPDDKRVLQLVRDHPATFAPAIAQVLDQLPVPQRIAALRTLSTAGRGLENQIARQLGHQNDGVVREALTTLGRIGSEEAAEFVTRHLQRTGGAHADASDLLWQFSPPLTCQCLRTLLRQRQFVAGHPDLSLRLLERLDQNAASKLGDVLKQLAPLRFRFWNRSLARVGWRAAALLH